MNSFDISKPVQTRDGLPVQVLASGLDLDGGDSIVAVVDGAVRTYRADGRFLDYDSEDDLINTPERETHKYAIGRRGSDKEGHFGVEVRPPLAVATSTNSGTSSGWANKALAITFEDGQPVAVELVSK